MRWRCSAAITRATIDGRLCLACSALSARGSFAASRLARSAFNCCALISAAVGLWAYFGVSAAFVASVAVASFDATVSPRFVPVWAVADTRTNAAIRINLRMSRLPLSAGSGLMWGRRLGEAKKGVCERHHAAIFEAAARAWPLCEPREAGQGRAYRLARTTNQ